MAPEYRDYTVWRHNDTSGETITIKNGIRKTTKPLNNTLNKEYWFFGGSTTWGYGVNDANTYPSHIAAKFNVKAVNFGEIAYIARQSLALLNNIIITSEERLNNKEITVIFYDGVNEVATRCRHEGRLLSTAHEIQIRRVFDNRLRDVQYSYARTFAQLLDMISDIGRKTGLYSLRPDNANALYSCHSNPKKARAIARTLVST